MLKQKDFSQFYFFNFNPWVKKEDLKDKIEHPFIFIESYMDNLNTYPYLNTFEKAQIIFNDIKDYQKAAYNCFELELNLLQENRIMYLNQIVNRLLKTQKDLRQLKRKEILNKHKPIHIVIHLLINSVKEILQSIFIAYHLELNNSNRETLSKWFYLKKAVVSFRLNKYPEDRRFERLYNEKLIKKGFISQLTNFATFKSLFEARQLENKINWIDRKSTLYYFIKLLLQYNAIKNPKNRHWEVASEFFLLKGESLLPKDFLNQKETMNKVKRKHLESFVKALV
ncbi:hypothetical protein E1J38_002290 [Seonamhaeicola sediminis]|uniref:Uncharacterized protein n=1 Tax=Seonamhaeicola sediminis TaxID=2528206 RepID=A0A562YIW0_9FLAO|nr:hypothetical protein [Seonamhaeicola sediminis]TWO34708.1 hypothetical protein E1J38_002290 [Seonamhaeicola sediminis]